MQDFGLNAEWRNTSRAWSYWSFSLIHPAFYAEALLCWRSARILLKSYKVLGIQMVKFSLQSLAIDLISNGATLYNKLNSAWQQRLGSFREISTFFLLFFVLKWNMLLNWEFFNSAIQKHESYRCRLKVLWEGPSTTDNARPENFDLNFVVHKRERSEFGISSWLEQPLLNRLSKFCEVVY